MTASSNITSDIPVNCTNALREKIAALSGAAAWPAPSAAAGETRSTRAQTGKSNRRHERSRLWPADNARQHARVPHAVCSLRLGLTHFTSARNVVGFDFPQSDFLSL